MRKPIVLMLMLLVAGALPVLAGWDEGVAAFTKKDYDTARSEFQELVDQNPEGWRGHYMLGLSFEQLNKDQEALNHLRKAYDLNPNELSIKLALGRAYHNAKRYSDVGKLLGPVDASGLPAKQQSAFYQMRGKARMETGDENGGLTDLKALAKLNPKDAQIQYLYGAQLAKADRVDESIDALGNASRLDPSDTEKKRSYITALLKKGRMTRDKNAKLESYKKAAALANELATAAPTYDNLLLECSAELGGKLYNEAIGSCEKAAAKKTGDWLAYFYTGQAYCSAGRYAEAEGPLKTALGKTKQLADTKNIWNQLGFAYEKLKKFSDSIEAYTNAGNQVAATRVAENDKTARENAAIEAENEKIRQMKEEADRLEQELKAIEGGGGGR